jgi:hypothetical protein
VFGLPPLADRIPITVLLTQQGMDNTAGLNHRLTGVSLGRTGDISFLVPRLSGTDPTLPTGASEIARTVIHELTHAVRTRLSRNAADQPSWLVEGAAERIAESVLDPDDHGLSLAAANRLRRLRASLGTTRHLPLEKLLLLDIDEHHQSSDQIFSAVYDEGYAFNRFLDTGDRRARYRALLRQVSGMSRALLPTRVAARVRELFGDLSALEREWIASINALALPPWLPTFAGEAVIGADGSVVLHSLARRGSLLDYVSDRMPRRITCTFEANDAAHLIVGVGATALHLIDGEPTRFYWWRNKIKRTLEGPVWKRTPGPHALELSFAPDRLRISIDGQVAVEGPLDGPLPPAKGDPRQFGTWGLGVFDGRVIYRDVRSED